jgi:hypothetical protein
MASAATVSVGRRRAPADADRHGTSSPRR